MSSAADAGAGTGNVGDPEASCHQDPPAEIAVRVQTSDGKPVEGAAVSVAELGLSGTTGADGVHDFGEVAPGSYTVSGQKDTFSPSGGSPSSPASQSLAATSGTSTQYELVLDPGATISVHVQQTDGTAVQGATVSVDGKGWSGVTDASGNFDFGAVAPDSYTITGQKDCFNPAPASQTQNAPASASTQYRLILDPIMRIYSMTVATSPANQARLRIGVGEEVDLTVSPGPATWVITSGSGTLTPNSGSQTNVRFTASDLAETVVITATNGSCSCSISFTIVQPSSWTMVRQPGTNLKHTSGIPDCGWMGITYFHPDDVNFYRVEDRELDSQAVATGSYIGLNGLHHGNYPPPDHASQWFPIPVHVEGSGSTDNAPDMIYCSPGPTAAGSALPFNVGTLYCPITLQWRVNGSANVHNFPVVRQEHEIFADGRCEARKGGHTEHSMYNDGTSTY